MMGAFVASWPASAQTLQDSAGQAALRSQAQIEALRQEQQRLQFQQQQQFDRELERRDSQTRPLAPQVPVMRPGCQLQVYGNRGGGC